MQSAARSALSDLVEDQLTSLVREATCVQRHAKRSRFHRDGGGESSQRTTRDWDGSGVVKVRLLDAEDVNLALQWRGCERLYATSSTTVAPPGSSSPSEVVDLNAYVFSDMDGTATSAGGGASPPAELGMALHWLAVDGVQPLTPANPLRDLEGQQTAGGADGTGSSITMVHNLLDVDGDDDIADEAGDGGAVVQRRGGESSAGRKVNVRRLLPHLLSEELRLFFVRVTLAIEGAAAATSGSSSTMTPQQRRQRASRIDAAVRSVATGVGIQELVPFFVKFVTSEIYGNLHAGGARYCRVLIGLVGALIANPNLHLELHLHQMIPAIISCVVARRVSSPPSSSAATTGGGEREDEEGEHWLLREEAARTLLNACDVFGDQYVTLKARVLKTLCEALDPSKSLPTRYGGIVGITLFGPKAIDAFILPIATMYWTGWEREVNASGVGAPTIEERRRRAFDVGRCQQAILNALGSYMKGENLVFDKDSYLLEESFLDVFGERLIPFVGDGSTYASCFV